MSRPHSLLLISHSCPSLFSCVSKNTYMEEIMMNETALRQAVALSQQDLFIFFTLHYVDV